MRISSKHKPQTLWLLGQWVMRGVLGAVALVLLVFVVAYGYVWSAPRNVETTLNALLADVAPDMAPYRATLGPSTLHISKFGGPLQIDIQDARLLHGDTLTARVPALELQLGFSLVPWPHVVLKQAQAHDVALAFPQGMTAPQSGGNQSGSGQGWRKIGRYLGVRELALDGTFASSFEAAQPGRFKLNAVYKHGKIQGAVEVFLPEEPRVPALHADMLVRPRTGQGQWHGTFANLRPSALNFFPLPAWLAGAELPLSGTMDGAFGQAGIQDATIQFEANGGRYGWSELFAAPLNVVRLSGKVHAKDALKCINISDVQLQLPETMLTLGMALVDEGHGYRLEGKGRLGKIAVDASYPYWPLVLAPNTRNWAVENIHRGVIEEATLTFRVTPEDLAAPHLPAQAIDAHLKLAGAEVRYLPTHPLVRDVHGLLHITGERLDFDIQRAAYLSNTAISTGRITIPDLNAAETALEADLTLNTTAPDAARLLAVKEIQLAQRLKLDPAKASGTASGRAQFSAIIFSSMPTPPPGYFEDHFDYHVQTQLKGVGQPKFMGKTDISDADMALDVDRHKLSLKGPLKLFGVPATLALEGDFDKDTMITDVALTLPAEKLPLFGYPITQGVHGPLGIKARINDNGRVEVTEATVDGTEAEVGMAETGYTKPKGKAAKLVLVSEKPAKGPSKIKQMEYIAGQDHMRGTLALDAAGAPSEVHITDMRLGRQQASVDYVRGKGRPKLRVRGASLDLSPWRKSQEDKADHSKSGNPLDPGPIDVDVSLGKIWLNKALPIEQFTLSLACSNQRCERAAIRGSVPSTGKEPPAPFAVTIAPAGAQRSFELSADNGGRLLNALDVLEHIDGGKTRIKGTYHDERDGALEGRVHVDGFFLKQAPLLTRILSLTSPLGIVNALTGKGIEFSHFDGKFGFKDGTVSFKDVKASGSAIGFTGGGGIQTGSTQIALKGTVIPAYMINSVIGKIPVIGELLVGGKGQGLIASRFSVAGTYDDPKVSVNALSILTPGFLRGLFDLGDEEDAVGDAAPAKPAGPSPTVRRGRKAPPG